MTFPATFIPDDAPASFEPDTPESFQSDPVTSPPQSQEFSEQDFALADPEYGGVLSRTASKSQPYEVMQQGIPTALGVTPNLVPSGASISKSPLARAVVGPIGRMAMKPMSTVASSVAKTGLGMADYMTSRQGISELVTSMSPLKLIVLGKWAYDMAKGSGEEAGTLSELLKKPDKTPEDWQEISDHTVNTLAMTFGAGALGKSGFKTTRSLVEPKTMKAVRELESQLASAEPNKLGPDQAAAVNLGLPPRAPAQPMLPELARTQELMNLAVQEANQKIVVPGKIPALDLLKAQDRVIVPESITAAERVQGGGQAPYGKISYMRGAEAPTTERTQQATAPVVEENLTTESTPGGGMSTKSVADQARQAEANRKMQEKFAKEVEAVEDLRTAPTTEPPRAAAAPGDAEAKGKETNEQNIQATTEGSKVGTGQKVPPPEKVSQTPKARTSTTDPKTGKSRRLLPVEQEFLDAHGVTIQEAIAKGSIRPVKEISKYGKERIVGYEPNAADSYRFTSANEAMAKQKELRDVAESKITPDEKLRESVWSDMTDAERRKVRQDPRIFDLTNGALDWEVLRPYAEKQGKSVVRNLLTTEAPKPPSVPNPSEPVTAPERPEASPLGTDPAQASGPQTLSEKLAALKFKADKDGTVLPEIPGQTFSLPHPDAIKLIGKQIWNDAIDVAIKLIQSGKSATDAIEAAIAHIRKNASLEAKSNLDDANLRDNLNSALTPAAPSTPTAAPSAPVPTPATPAPTAKPSTPGVTLDDVYKIFEPVKKKRSGVRQVMSDVSESVRTGLASRFRPIDKLAEDIAAEYGVKTPRGIAGIFEQIKGASGKGEADIYRFDQEVSKPLRGHEKDFNPYMFLRRSLDRLLQDQEDIKTAMAGGVVKKLNRRQVSDYTIPELEAKLAKLESELGPETVAKFEKAAQAYQVHMDNALKLQVQSGRMTPEGYQAIKDGNQFYAPFKVKKYLESTSIPEGSGRRVDTLADFTKAMEGIHDKDLKLGDMLGAARQNIMLSRILAEKNRAMLNITKLAGFDTKGKFVRKLKAMEDVPLDMDSVNVFEGGKPVKYVVNKDVAQALKIYGKEGGNFLTTMAGAFSVPFRAGATMLNVPFQAVNLLGADIPRQALISKYGIKGSDMLVRYLWDFSDSLLTSIVGNNVGYKNKLFKDFLDSGAAGSTIQETLTPKSLNVKPYSLPKSAAKSVVWALPDFARAIEQTSKIMGVRRAMRIEGAASGKELAAKIPEAITEIRRFSGSPDFGRQGKWTEQARLNIWYMFFNARLQGVTADMGRLLGRDGSARAAKTWLKVGSAVGLPTIYLYLLNQDEEYAADYEKRPAHEKRDYWLIPKDTFITNQDGEKIRDYWRIPKRESAKWIANMAESAMDFARNRDPEHFARFATGMMEDISPVNIQGKTLQERMESTATSLNPMLKAPLELGTGRDMYRHRNIVPDAMKKASPKMQYTDRTSEIFKSLANALPESTPDVLQSPLMLENLTKNLTAGLFTQFLPRKPVEGRSGIENNPLMQRFQGLPVTDRKAFDEEMQSMEREAADAQLTRHRNAVKIMDSNKGKTLEQMAEAAVKQFGDDPKLIRHLIDLNIAKERGITGEEKQLLSLPAQQRAAYIAKRVNDAPAAAKEAMLEGFASKRILTEAVAVELEPLLTK